MCLWRAVSRARQSRTAPFSPPWGHGRVGTMSLTERPVAGAGSPGLTCCRGAWAGLLPRIHHRLLSPEGADGGASSAGNGSGGPPAPAGGSRASSRSLGSSGGEKEEGKKVRRQWESWSTEDKNTFFEGLYEVSARGTRPAPASSRPFAR